MRFVRVAAIVAFGAAPSTAQAADVPAVSPIDLAVANAAHDWAGAYAGVNLGYSWGEFSTEGPATVDDPTFQGNGPLGGFQIGYNKQLGSVVIGVEGDLQAAGIEESTSGGGATATTSLDWFSTARGRVGYAFDSTMVYGTAGLAVGGLSASVSGPGGGSDDTAALGWTAGAGVEQKITDNLSLKAEYLYVDTEKKSLDTGAAGTDAEWDGHVMRFGANFKF
jgi:outer membrane immunogenic protein